jgi:chemotaxis regulatin CheY-phosphate phosphatase CheZ
MLAGDLKAPSRASAVSMPCINKIDSETKILKHSWQRLLKRVQHKHFLDGHQSIHQQEGKIVLLHK